MKRVKPALILLCLLLSALLPARSAWAATCTVSAQNVSFGSYSSFDASALDSTGQVTVTCISTLSELVNYIIKLSPGSSGSNAARFMAQVADHLNYNLYTNSVRSTVWGDGTGASSTISDSYTVGLISSSRSYTVYGRLFALQNVPAGIYSDSIVVTVDY